MVDFDKNYILIINQQNQIHITYNIINKIKKIDYFSQY